MMQSGTRTDDGGSPEGGAETDRTWERRLLALHYDILFRIEFRFNAGMCDTRRPTAPLRA